MEQIKAISFGGGVQSTALLVLAATNQIDSKLFLFANVGEDSENPATLQYLNDFSKPYAESFGIELCELRRIRRDGSPETLLERIERSQRSIPIPVRMSNGAPGNRQCTGDFKIKTIAKELKRRGATKDNPAIVGLGISIDEYQRMRTESSIPYQTLWYPLIDMRLSRADCTKIILSAGLPLPPKSSCYFCPFHSMAEWRRLRREEPVLFAKSVEMEKAINEKRERLGKDSVWFSSKLIPLLEATDSHGQLELASDEKCSDAGYCMV